MMFFVCIHAGCSVIISMLRLQFRKSRIDEAVLSVALRDWFVSTVLYALRCFQFVTVAVRQANRCNRCCCGAPMLPPRYVYGLCRTLGAYFPIANGDNVNGLLMLFANLHFGYSKNQLS